MRVDALYTAKPPRAQRAALALAALTALCVACTQSALPTNGKAALECCEGRGLCLPAAFLDAKQSALLGHDGCGEAMCVPNELRGRSAPATCQIASTGAEGRCLPACLPQVAARGGQLTRESCAEHQRCVPCYDPLTGASTDACSLGNDPGPAQSPRVFATCCEGEGRCVPRALVAKEQESALGRDACAGAEELCVPDDALAQGNGYTPAACLTQGTQLEGRCLPACLPALAAQKGRLGQSTCGVHALCAPCFDPVTGKSTGACNVGADRGPSGSPQTFETCCSGLGHCVPTSLLSREESTQLGADVCRQSATMCVPDSFSAKDFRPATCTLSEIGAEGRCLPDCLPKIAGQRAQLKQESCAAHHLCTPCVDPVSGEATGACKLGTDPGPSLPPVVFGACCSGNGRCVPSAAVPAAQRSQLRRDGCGERDLCVPNEIAARPDFVPAKCEVSALRAEGRCLSSCLKQVAERPGLFQADGCAGQTVCLPCSDPLTGDPSGACSFTGDPGPMSAAAPLAQCCGGLGRCTPRSLIPKDQSANFGGDTCADPGTLCVAPSAALSDPHFVPQSCQDASTGAEGRCLPKCLPAVAPRAAALRAANCPAEQLCVPCFDPIGGKSTGACNSPSDPGPSKPPVVFETCCGASAATASGLCVPTALVPAGSPELPKQTCSAANSVCVPRVIVDDPKASFPPCTSIATQQGVCIESCYLSNAAQLVSFAGDCQPGRLCVACSLVGSTIGGCAR